MGVDELRACPDWPQLMEIAPELQFKHYTLREAQLPTEAFVQLEGVDSTTVAICCDLEPRLQPGAHRPPSSRRCDGTHWLDLRERAFRARRARRRLAFLRQ